MWRSLTRLPIFIVLAHSEAKNSSKHRTPPPQLPQRERMQSGYVNHVSTTFVYSTHQVSSQSLHSKRFARFLPPPQLPPVSPDLVGISAKSCVTWVPSKYQISLRSGNPFLRKKYLNFYNFSELTPPPQLPQREQIRSNYADHVSRTFTYSSRQVSSRSLHSKCCPRFPVSKISISPSSPLCCWIRFEIKMEHLRHKIFLYIKFQ